MSNKNKSQKPSTKEKAALLIMVGAIAVMFAPYLLTRNSCFPAFSASTGAIGDTIGGITAPIVGMLGAILVFYALLEQIKANKIISDQFLEQKKVTHRQNFEQTFFSMLNIHHEMVNNIQYAPSNLVLDITHNAYYLNLIRIDDEALFDRINSFPAIAHLNGNVVRGRDFFQFSLEVLTEGIFIADRISGLTPDSQFSQFNNLQTGDTFDSFFNEVYEKCFHQFDTHLGHYYRNLYRIIKMIDEQKFSEDERENYEIKYFYTSIVRSQLSDYEIKWLFFNSIFDYGKKFKPLIERYSLLKILRGNPDETIIKFKVLYNDTAFEKIN